KEGAAEHGVHQRRAQDRQRHFTPHLACRMVENVAARLMLLEHETVHRARSDDDADDRHQKADEKEDAPTPGVERLCRHQRLNENDGAETEQQADRNRKADPGAQNARRFECAACSTTQVEAVPNSAPKLMPCNSRKIISNIGATTPIWS